MATFLYRAEHRGVRAGPPVQVPTDGTSVVVPPGQPFTAEFDAVTVEGPAGALSGGARLRIQETSVGTRGLAEGRALVADPIALSVTGAAIVEPLTIRIETDTESLKATTVVPAYWSAELDTWVPIAAESIDVGDGEIVVRATLSDAELVTVSGAALGPTLMAGRGAPSVAGPGAVVIGLIKIFIAVTTVVTVVSLTSDLVRDRLAEFFGLRVKDSPCPNLSLFERFILPRWVDGVSHSDDALSESRARLHACGEADGDYLRVRVANNRNYGIQLKASAGDHPVSLASGSEPSTLIEQAVKALAEWEFGDSYLWPLSESDFLLPPQRGDRGDWSGEWGPTWETALVDVLRLALDLLFNVVLPGVKSGANDSSSFRRFECVRQAVNDIPGGSFDVGSPTDWMRAFGLVSTLLKNCLMLDADGLSVLAEDARAAVRQVVNALGKLSLASSAAKWGITFADALRDATATGAWIRVDIDESARGVEPPSGPGNSEPFSELDAGSAHTCALRADKTVACWGANQDDQYNQGQTEAPPGTFEAISAGTYHSCGVRTDGSIECWGDYRRGQTSPPSGNDFRGVTSGDGYSCGLRRDGSITCWGDNTYGQTQAPPGEFLAVSAGYYSTCAVRVSGAAVCWGGAGAGQDPPEPPRKFFNAVSKDSHGLRTDGATECWSPTLCTFDKHHPGGTFKAIDTHSTNICGLRTNGSVECWGDPVHTAAPLEGPYSAVTVGSRHLCMKQPDGSIHCTGDNSHGQTDVPADLAVDPEDGVGGLAAALLKRIADAVGDRDSRVAYRKYRTAGVSDLWAELWTAGADGSNATKLASNSIVSGGEPWSPDGTRIAYVSERADGTVESWIAGADGSNPVKLPLESRRGAEFGAWSPDGMHVLFLLVGDTGNELWTVRADGSNPTRLHKDVPYQHLYFAWSSDGTRVAYLSVGADGSVELWIVGADGSNPVKLGRAYGWSPGGWSPDGARVAYEAVDGSLWTAGADGSNPAKLSGEGTLLHPRDAWSPDGTRIAYTVQLTDGSWETWTVGADGSNPVKLGGWFRRWSPDGARVAYVVERADGGREDWIAGADGSNPVRLAGVFTCWSPDGARVAYETVDGGIGIAGADGSSPFKLSGTFAGWSLDGTRFAYTVARLHGIRELWTAGADGSDRIKLASVEGLSAPGGCHYRWSYGGGWSSGGSRVVYSVARADGSLELWIVGADGSNPVKLANHGSLVQWSP